MTLPLLASKFNKGNSLMIYKTNLIELKKKYEEAKTKEEVKEALDKFTFTLRERQEKIISDPEFKV